MTTLDTFVHDVTTSQRAVVADKGQHLLEMTAALVGPCIIRTYTGQMVDLFDPDPETLCIEDVAHHLSLINRFTGATGRAYSVAEHSLLGRLACSEQVKLLFLVHDAPEAWLGDVAGPLKRLLAPLYKPLEQRFWERFATKYGIPVELPEEVHTVDKRMLATEQRDLQGRKPKPEDAYQPFDWELDFMCGDILRAEDNEQAFLRTFYLDLQKGRWRA
jgi:5'-deoxynucleotidase YfbR-like HD superfamily hydrolase